MPKEKKRTKTQKKITRSKKNIDLFIKSLPTLTVLVTLIFIGAAIHRAIFSSGYFTVDLVRLVWHDESGVISPLKYNWLSRLGVGKNIFSLNIKDLTKKIISEQPEFQNCVLRRIFPNRLLLDIYARQPVAQIEYGKFYLVDKENILISEPRQTQMKEIPVIIGVGWWPSRKVGERIGFPELFGAMKLINALEKSGLLKDYSLEKIDVSDSNNIIFYIGDNLEIKIGHENFDERLALLKEAFLSSYVNTNDLEYIDLRFDDIVFGTR